MLGNTAHDGTSWSSLSTADHLNYCEDDDGATGKNIDKVGGSVNSLKYGTSAGSSDDCTSSNFESDWMYG